MATMTSSFEGKQEGSFFFCRLNLNRGSLKAATVVYRVYYFLFRYMRMKKETFALLLNLVREKLTKKTTNFRKPVPPEVRLAATLRFLGQGDSMIFLSITYRLGHSTVVKILRETLQVTLRKIGLGVMFSAL